MPLTVPGAAVSPGSNTCSFAKGPTLTWMDGEVDCWMDGVVTSEAVRVDVPIVRRVTLKVFVPEESAAFAGNVALLSEEESATVSVAVLIMFQLASTALTVTLNALPEFSEVGVPVLPLVVPGAAVSPGAKICNLAKAPTFTVMAGLVLPGIAACVTSEAVTVALPAVLSVTLNMPLPLALAWRRDNTSTLLAHFIGEVRRLPDVRAVNKG